MIIMPMIEPQYQMDLVENQVIISAEYPAQSFGFGHKLSSRVNDHVTIVLFFCPSIKHPKTGVECDDTRRRYFFRTFKQRSLKL